MNVSGIGRLTRDAELKQTNSGYPICKFAVAVNKKVKSGEEWIDEANFFDVVLFGKIGEALNQYLKKGKQVYIVGELKQNRWESDGIKKSKVEIIARDIKLIGGVEGTEKKNTSNSSETLVKKVFEDDIPF